MSSISSNGDASKMGVFDALPPELREMARHRLKSEQIGLADKFMPFAPKKALRFLFCNTCLHFDAYENMQTGDLKRCLTYGNFCRCNKFCPTCSWIYDCQTAADLLGRFAHMQRDRKAANLSPYRYLFLTLTVKNCPLGQLREQLREMSKGWQRFIQTKKFQQAITGGWFRGVEYLGDETDPGMAHPHFHVLLVVTSSFFTKYYIKQAEWVQMWRDAMRIDYDPIVDIRRVKPRLRKIVDTAGQFAERVQSGASAAASEVCKYSVAPTQVETMSDADFQTLYQQTLHGRVFAMGGKLKETEPDPAEILDMEVWRYLGVEVWRWGQGQYVMTNFANAKRGEDD